MLETVRIKSLHVYPLKGAAGIAMGAVDTTPYGLTHDRQWMLVDANGVFLSQRTAPTLALLQPKFADTHFVIQVPEQGPVHIPLVAPAGCVRRTVQIWDDPCEAVVLPDKIGAWFRAYLGMPCQLVQVALDRPRYVDQRYVKGTHAVGFADAFPLMLMSQGSLNELGRRLVAPVPMNRFRPNIVVDGCPPFAEDGWQALSVDTVKLLIVKPRAHDAVVNIDQSTGLVALEPLRTLTTFRTQQNQILLGQSLVHEGQGPLKVGDILHCTQRIGPAV